MKVDTIIIGPYMEVDEIHVRFNISEYERTWAEEERKKMIQRELEIMKRLEKTEEAIIKPATGSGEPVKAKIETVKSKADLEQELKQLLDSVQSSVKKLIDSHVDFMTAMATILNIRAFFEKNAPDIRQVQNLIAEYKDTKPRWAFSVGLADYMSLKQLRQAEKYLKAYKKSQATTDATSAELLKLLVSSMFFPSASTPLKISQIFKDYPLGSSLALILQHSAAATMTLAAGLPTEPDLLSYYNDHKATPLLQKHQEALLELAQALQAGQHDTAFKSSREMLTRLRAADSTRDIADQLQQYLDRVVQDLQE